MQDFDEKHLITRAQHGDTDAFNPLVREYQPRIYTYIARYIKNHDTTKDLCQETWLKAFRAINTFRGDSAFSSWIYRIAENVCIDFLRKQKTTTTIDSLHAIDERRLLCAHPDPCDLLQQQELRQYLHEAIATLTPPRKRVFLLYYIEELSIKAIAIRIGRSEGTVKTHLRNARLQLQEHLTPYVKNENIPWLQ